MSRKNRSFRKEQHLSEGDNILAKYVNTGENAPKKEETLKLNESEYTINGKSFIIKKWDHLDALDRLPDYINIWFAHLGATTYSTALDQEMDMSFDFNSLDPTTLALMFVRGFQDLHFKDMIVDFLDGVRVKGQPEDSKIDLNKDIENPVDILKLFMEVSKVNFMMQLSQTIFTMPLIMLDQESKKN